MQILDPWTDEVIRELEATAEAGLNRVRWDLREDPEDPDDDAGPVVDAGTYRVRLVVDGIERVTRVEVVEDAWFVVAG